MPLVKYNGRYVVVSSSRIANREELCVKLDLSKEVLPNVTDEYLFSECYDKWHHDCPKHIIGEWVFALWDHQEKELFIATSHYWHTNLYFYKSTSAFFFASSLKGLLVLEEIPKDLNEFRLAQIIIGWNNNYGETLYKHLHCLGPAHSLRISPGKFVIHRYWALEDTLPIRYNTDHEYIEAFREIYSESIRCRIRSSRLVGSSLSGGLDSGAVTALTAKELAVSNETLQAFSSVPLFNTKDLSLGGRFGDESEFILATAQLIDNVEVNWIRSEKRSPIQAIKEISQLLDEPPVAAANLYWIVSMLEAARNKNIDTFLVGQLGNATISWKGKFDGLVNWSAFYKDTQFYDRKIFRSVLGSVKQHLIMPWIPFTLLRYWEQRKDPENNWLQYPIINKDFALQQKLTEKIQEKSMFASFDTRKDFRASQLQMIKPMYASPSIFWTEIGRLHNLWISDPLADKRVLEFCTSIPNSQFYRNGVDKYLIKRALKGVLPDRVLWNKKRGQQAADLQQRLLEDLPELNSIISSFKQSDVCNHYMDVAKIESALSSLHINNLTAFLGAAKILISGTMIGLFLKRFS
jgi:asparagine synthase (glutamine-hydrolysing)